MARSDSSVNCEDLAGFAPGHIFDAGGPYLQALLTSLLREKLTWTDEPWCVEGVPQRLLPSPLLSDETGLKLWEKINRLPTYYQTDGEIELFRKNGRDIAEHVQPDSALVDLGCGDVRKVQPLLDVLDLLEKPVWYFALDLCRDSLSRAMELVSTRYRFVKCYGLWGTFDTGLDFLETLTSTRPRLFLSLGSSFGNDYFHMAVARLREWKNKALSKPGDAMLLTMDGTTDPRKIWDSYHDEQGLFEKFIRNGYLHSNRVLQADWYRDEDWDLVGILSNDPEVHSFALRARRDIDCQKLKLWFPKGQQIDCYEAFKYRPELMRRQFAEAGLQEQVCWKAPNHELYQYMLHVPRTTAPMNGPWSS